MILSLKLLENKMADDEDDVFVAEERYGSSSVQRKFKFTDESRDVKKYGDHKPFFGSSLKMFFKSAFLPQGYPESVSKDYLTYQFWDTVQAFCSSITGTLATQAMLKGYGVGDESATALAATMTWILRSGTGMVGSILFAWMQGSNLDCNAKKWRLFADIMNDLAILVELISPYFKAYFTLLACLSSVAKSIVGVAGGSTRAALTQHQARRDNMADVAAKDGSQETLVNLMALLAGLVITPLVTGHTLLTWVLFIIFTFLHLYANYCAVSSVVMETLNTTRLQIVTNEFLRTGHVLSPDEVGKMEPVIFGSTTGERLKINLGSPFTSVIQSIQDFRAALPNSKESRYLMRVNFNASTTSGVVNIVLHESAESIDFIQSCFQAAVIDHVIRTPLPPVESPFKTRTGARAMEALHNFWWEECLQTADLTWDLIAQAHNFTLHTFPDFLAGLERSGWVTSRTHLGPDEWRSVWNASGVEPKKKI
ncbi:RUS family member 1 [Nematostella vectensis]|uniref:RUS family member 1 n=1 Tax=Nematostella vectensis TaxID=45351 RepID=UPI0020771BBD|nr:RUS family member 1 [Nematostella vectensis]